ncbi:hypothetical protein [uncultured Intestinimonas sp.]|uniref:hypothetical protein n=1 Tax=uncultured Intestinimonas sp. TaxID=1689265 RepID=UPI0025E8A4C7|nr:hypothetical protein [uncultured Intestinimonas sp.]
MSLEEIIAQAGAEVEAKRREGEEIIRDILRVNGICDDYQPPQRKANPNISFRPLVRQGNSDTLLICVPEHSFRAYNYSDFRDAADDAIAHVQHNRMTFCPGGAAYQYGFDIQKRPLAMWGLDAEGRPTAFFNVSIADGLELQQAHWMIDANRSKYTP